MTTTTILVVEDEKIIAKGIEKRLKGLGYAVAASASTGEEAIQKAVQHRPDLILMDIHLGGGMDGVETARLIRSQMDVPVVYLTAHSDIATLQRAKLTAPFGYVLKPYEDKDLQTAIEIGLYKHQMEQQLRDHEQWLAATLASIGDGVIATDEQGRVRFMNAPAERLTGWTQAAACNRDVREVFRAVEAKTGQPVLNLGLDALGKGEFTTTTPNTVFMVKTEAKCPIDGSAAPIRDANGKVTGAVLVFRDISARRSHEEQVRQAQKLEAIGRLAGGMAHHLNNMMTTVTGFSEIVLMRLSEDDALRHFVEEIKTNGQRAASLASQLLVFSQRQSLMPVPFDLNALLRETEPMLRCVLQEGIELVMDTDPALPVVMADPKQVKQMVIALAMNACEVMPHGGRLTIQTSVGTGSFAALVVSDTGPGMDKKTQDNLFEPFFTDKGLGTEPKGLGLAAVYGTVKQSGGHVEVRSDPGCGTAFTIYLPRPKAIASTATALPAGCLPGV
jgi:PAS domain S-box-containing protein